MKHVSFHIRKEAAMHGIGKDIEQGGKKTQEVADSVKNKM